MDEKVESDFVWYIVSVPSIAETQDILPKPTFVTSTYDSFSYSAVYASIPDIEARGFSRSICLVIASKKEEIIFAVRSLFYTEIGKIIDAARENAAALFLSEIDTHIEALSNHLETAEIKEEGQRIKLERLKEIKETMSGKIEKRLPFSKERCSKNALLFINDDLRKIEFIIDFSVLQNQIMEILRSISLPNSVLMGQLFAPECCSNVYVPSLNVPEDRSLNSLARSNVLKHVLYSMLTGRTIVILSSSIESVRPLAISLVELMPFRWENDLCVRNAPVNDADCSTCSVVVATALTSSNNMIATIDFDNNTYTGPACPDKSYIMKMPLADKHGEGVFWLRLNYAINNFKERYQRFSLIILSRTPKEYFDLSPSLEMHGFSNADEQIFSFFTLAMNSGEWRPVPESTISEQITVSL